MGILSIVHLFTHSTITRGGAVQGLLLARTLQESGHRVTSFFHQPFGRKQGERPSPCHTSETSGLDIRRINMKNPTSYFRFRRWLEKEKIDVIHAHRNLALLFAFYSTLGPMRFPPVLIANRGTTYPLSNPLVKHVFLSTRLTHVVVVAKAVKDVLVEEGVPSDKISVVYGSFDAKRFYPRERADGMRESFGVGPKDPLIVCIAAVDRRKGLEFLMQAISEIRRRHPSTRLVVAGNIDDSDYFGRIRNEVSRLNLGHSVIFTGHRTDIPDILAAADVSVNASTEGEGFTGALRESLAMQKPVVCTRVCGNPELVVDGESGWVVERANVQGLAAALLEALGNRDEAKRRAENGYRSILRLCSNEIRCRRIEEIYSSLCGTHRAARGSRTLSE